MSDEPEEVLKPTMSGAETLMLTFCAHWLSGLVELNDREPSFCSATIYCMMSEGALMTMEVVSLWVYVTLSPMEVLSDVVGPDTDSVRDIMGPVDLHSEVNAWLHEVAAPASRTAEASIW